MGTGFSIQDKRIYKQMLSIFLGIIHACHVSMMIDWTMIVLFSQWWLIEASLPWLIALTPNRLMIVALQLPYDLSLNMREYVI